MTAYHNSTNLKHETLFRAEQKAKSQNIRILEFFEMFRTRNWTASEVWDSVGMKSEGSPLTSTRRAISNLIKQGKLIKTEMQTEGIYGRMEYVYRLTSSEPIIHTLF